MGGAPGTDKRWEDDCGELDFCCGCGVVGVKGRGDDGLKGEGGGRGMDFRRVEGSIMEMYVFCHVTLINLKLR